MKIVSIKASGLPLFKENLDVHFFASQRVQDGAEENLYQILPKVFLNNVSGFIGINASGKTTVLRTIDFALHLLNNDPLNHIQTRDVLGNTEKAIFDIIFLSNRKQVCRLVTTIRAEKDYVNSEPRYSIIEEELYSKPLDSVKYKKQLTDFSGCADVVRRNGTEDFLLDDISIVIAINKRNQDHVFISSLLELSNVNVLEFTEEIPNEIIKFLDPSIESIHIDHDDKCGQIHLKFIGQEEILLNRVEELNCYLS
ncbi:MAG: ATP-binding protein, partial [Eubacterium sp.]|nr:ATP-binding protein [Eubacterium sp.]